MSEKNTDVTDIPLGAGITFTSLVTLSWPCGCVTPLYPKRYAPDIITRVSHNLSTHVTSVTYRDE